jgi:sporadic carbohydrate cluster protein (TIGR04323 family)
MNKARGYIFSRPFMGERVPQHVQNLVIRDYCTKNGIQYLLSATEYAMQGSYMIHEQLMSELSSLDGVVAYSLYQLPENASDRKKIYQSIIKCKKIYHFALESLSMCNKPECERIEILWRVKQTLPNCYNYVS